MTLYILHKYNNSQIQIAAVPNISWSMGYRTYDLTRRPLGRAKQNLYIDKMREDTEAFFVNKFLSNFESEKSWLVNVSKLHLHGELR